MDIKQALKDFRRIPGVGPSIAQDFVDMGYTSVQELEGESPEKMYEKLSLLKGCHVDRCMLYVFRCAVYFASHTEYNPRLLKWWNWKDDTD